MLKAAEKLLDTGEAAMSALVTRSSDTVVLGLALVLYIGIGLAMPLAAHVSTFELACWNVAGTALAVGIVLTLLANYVEATRRRNLLEWTTNLRHLDAAEFEHLVAEMFRRRGWKVNITGRHDAPDGNIDIEMSKDGQRTVVQCKCWERKHVGIDEIRKFGGTLLREGLRGSDGIFVTLSDFTSQARDEAHELGLILVDGCELLTQIESVRRSEPCPECGRPMRFDRSQHGWWFRCVAAGCRGKRDIGNEPAVVVELLTNPV